MDPFCQMLVTVPNAGIHERTKVPFEFEASWWVGSNHTSSPTMACKTVRTYRAHSGRGLTVEVEITRPNTSIPASANAALAATDPDAMHPSIPSASMIVMKISMADLGRVSRRTEGRIA